MRKQIHFTVIEDGIATEIETYDGEYKNLMFLLKDKLVLDSFGECGGMGRCATCVIKIEGLTGDAILKDRNEPVTLSKFGLTDENCRLSCQLLINQDLNDVEIELIEV